MKQLMRRLLIDHLVEPSRVLYLTCELIDDHHALNRHVEEFLESVPRAAGGELTYLFLDEVTVVPKWELAVKHLADAGMLEQTFVLVTGSDAVLIDDAIKRLPGRRGSADKVDFRYLPLSFGETALLRDAVPAGWLDEVTGVRWDKLTDELVAPHLDALTEAFRAYHVTDGYLTAINDWAATGEVSKATLRTYADWVRGDMLKQGKSDHYLREVLTGILRRFNTPVSWNSLAKDLKQIAKYDNGLIAARTTRLSRIGDVPVFPLPIVLARFS